MSAEELKELCDCYAYQEGIGSSHSLNCALWENPLFADGEADWDPQAESLVMVNRAKSLHDMTDDELAEAVGDIIADNNDPVDDMDPIEAAIADFDDRCLAIEVELWDCITSKTMDWPPFNYTIDGISRVFNQENCEWENEKLGCHCDPQEATSCNRCGVWREKPKGEGTFWEQQWRPSIVRKDDILCRCPDKKRSEWNCSVCEVKRMHTPVGVNPASAPMMRLTDDMKKSKFPKAKGGATAWSGFGTGKTSTAPITTFVQCRHKGRELKFPNEKTIYGSSCHAKAPEGYVPSFGFYLDSCWFSESQQLGIMLPWQDMGLPKIHRDHVDAAVTLACSMIDRGDIVEVGCIGGHGRTGTFLALIALRNGVKTPKEAIEYVRTNYCEKAIESDLQEWYVEAWYAEDNDLPIPEKPKPKAYGTVSSVSTYRKHVNVLSIKRCDAKSWYCPECNADVDDVAEDCYWCGAKFTNGGLRPIEEWFMPDSNRKKWEERIANPQKVDAKKLRKPPTPPKAVTTGTTPATQSALPFEVPNDMMDGYF